MGLLSWLNRASLLKVIYHACNGMVHPGPISFRPTDYVDLSFYSFAFWWLMILSVHLLACAYTAGFAKFYWDFDASFLSYSLETYDIGMPRGDFLTISYVHIVLACLHGACILHMFINLVRQGYCKRATMTTNRSVMPHKLDQRRTGSVVTRSFARVYMKVSDRRGFCGVNGKYFHEILIFREVVETALQTVKAIRMSKFLPHPQLNRFYVGLLVLNCWSSVLVYSRWFWRGEAHRRFALVVCDCALSLMTTVGVSTMIVLGYVNQYNVVLAGFNFDALADDTWVAQMLNEAQMILVVSWSDMSMRVFFSLGLIITTTNMNELLRIVPRSKHRIAPDDNTQLQPVTPVDLAPVNGHFGAHVPRSLLGGHTKAKIPEWGNISITNNTGPSYVKPKVFHRMHYLFALWGVVVLVLHLHAVSRTPLMECMPKVHPMAGALPSCFVVNFNCHDMGLSGTNEEVQAEWEKFDRRTVVKLHILHCPTFTMSVQLQDFTRLQDLRVYNSTIDDWNEEAAVTNTHHPQLTDISLVRTNIVGGGLPLGFQSLDFAGSLFEICFFETNLKQIPDDIDSKWHVGLSIYVENSQLTSVPSALIRLQPYYLVLGGNPITEVPSELFETDGMLYLVLSRTNISILPQTVLNPTMRPPFVDVRNTTVSFFWSWMDPLVETMLDVSPMILASGSTYCNDLDRIMNGDADSFSANLQNGTSPLLMNSSEQNWGLLRKAVDCTPPLFATYFPIDEWDTLYSLG